MRLLANGKRYLAVSVTLRLPAYQHGLRGDVQECFVVPLGRIDVGDELSRRTTNYQLGISLTIQLAKSGEIFSLQRVFY